MYNRTNKYTMALKRGTPVTFLGPVGDKQVWDKVQRQMNKKYGISIGDKGKVVRSNAGWTRVTWIRSDGSSAVSVPMRASWLKNMEKYVNDDLATRLSKLMAMDVPSQKSDEGKVITNKRTVLLTGVDEERSLRSKDKIGVLIKRVNTTRENRQKIMTQFFTARINKAKMLRELCQAIDELKLSSEVDDARFCTWSE